MGDEWAKKEKSSRFDLFLQLLNMQWSNFIQKKLQVSNSGRRVKGVGWLSFYIIQWNVIELQSLRIQCLSMILHEGKNGKRFIRFFFFCLQKCRLFSVLFFRYSYSCMPCYAVACHHDAMLHAHAPPQQKQLTAMLIYFCGNAWIMGMWLKEKSSQVHYFISHLVSNSFTPRAPGNSPLVDILL